MKIVHELFIQMTHRRLAGNNVTQLTGTYKYYTSQLHKIAKVYLEYFLINFFPKAFFHRSRLNQQQNGAILSPKRDP